MSRDVRPPCLCLIGLAVITEPQAGQAGGWTRQDPMSRGVRPPCLCLIGMVVATEPHAGQTGDWTRPNPDES